MAETGAFHWQKLCSRSIVAPIRLSGVDAPEVSPTLSAPAAGSQPLAVTSTFDPTGRCLMASADSRQSGSAMWNVGRDSAQMRTRFTVLLLL